MSTYRAVAAATAAFAQRIKQSIAPLEGAIVTTERPGAPQPGGPPRVNLFLYHVDANPYLTTDDLPTRRADGTLINPPKIALDLYYLLSFYGDDKLPALDPHILIGLTLSGVHAKPVLTPEELSAVDEAIIASDFIALTPLPLSIHELSRLWSMFFQVPYTVSVSLKASAAILIAELPAGPAPPVARRGLDVVLYTEPVMTGASAPGGEPGAVVFGGELLITGRGFGDGTLVVIGRAALTPTPGGVAQGRILLRLTDPALRAGAQALSVVTAAGFTSPPIPLQLRPRVTTPAVSGETLSLTIAPDVAADQRAELLLDRVSPAAEGAQSEFTLAAIAAAPDRLEASIAGLPPGRYAVRARVDGAESLLSYAGPGRGPSPVVTLGAPS